MKGFILLVAFVSTFLAVTALASAYDVNSCSNSNQTILSLYYSQNSHGAVWNDINYAYKICYDEIFGESYVPASGENVRACNGNNTVLRLSGTTNAHAEYPQGIAVGYSNVCYGDLVCTGKSVCDSSINETEIVRLSAGTNAHLGNLSSGYAFRICCTSAQSGIIPDLPPCGIGKTLCSDGICRTSCTSTTCNNNNICESGEGCTCSDCLNLQDSCENGLICTSSEVCEVNPNAGVLTRIQVIPNSSRIDIGLETQFEVRAFYSNDSIVDVTSLASCSSLNPEISDRTSGCNFIGVSTGNATINVSFADNNVEKEDFANLEVLTPGSGLCSHIVLDPFDSDVERGEMQEYSAKLVFSNNSFIDVTSITSFSSANPEIASMNGNNATGILRGDADIQGSYLGALDCPTKEGFATLHVHGNVIPAGTIGPVYWAHDANGVNKISTSRVNETVYLIAETGLGEGDNVTFNIYEQDIAFNDYIRNLNASVGPDQIARVSWKISDVDMAAADGLGEYIDMHAEFYFNASAPGTSNVSGILNTDKRGDDTNRPPVANITGPLHRQMYYVGVPIIFNQTSYDPDGSISALEWDIDDTPFVNANTNSFTHTYDSTGEKVITLKVTDNRGRISEDQVAILILNNSDLLAFINKPRHKEVIINNELIINYSAEDSYVVNSSVGDEIPSCNANVQCLAGNCPTHTQNSPLCSSDINAEVSVNGTPKTFSNINFSWTFSDGTGFDKFSRIGVAKGEEGYGSSGDKVIDLLINYRAQGFDLSVPFHREFTLLGIRQCSRDGQIWTDSDGREYNTVTGSGCAGANRIAGDTDDCCPSGSTCSYVNGRDRCTSPSPNTNRCDQYRDANNCVNDTSNVAASDPLRTVSPVCGTTVPGTEGRCPSYSVRCDECSWNATTSTCGLLKETRPSNDNCGGGPSDPDPGHRGLCSYSSTPVSGEQCDETTGEITVNVIATLIGSADPTGTCTNSQETIPCGRPSIALPFFSLINLISAILVIAIIYFAYSNFVRKRK